MREKKTNSLIIIPGKIRPKILSPFPLIAEMPFYKQNPIVEKFAELLNDLYASGISGLHQQHKVNKRDSIFVDSFNRKQALFLFQVVILAKKAWLLDLCHPSQGSLTHNGK